VSAALRLQGVSKSFGGLKVIDDVGFEVPVGSRTALIGPNGAGKSTLFNVISGSLSPSAGDVRLAGVSIAGQSPHQIARRGLARSFQISQLFARLSVRDHLRCACLRELGPHAGSWRGLWGAIQAKPAVRERVDHLLLALGLQDCADHLAAQLSYAQQRLLELGMVLAASPRVVLLDEPTAGMSRSETEAFVHKLRELTCGLALLLVEHDMQVVFELADQVAVLHEGRVLACGTPAQVRADALVRQVYLNAQGGAA
jgi:branched-chain amino acid transport system ATP-binding protein